MEKGGGGGRETSLQEYRFSHYWPPVTLNVRIEAWPLPPDPWPSNTFTLPFIPQPCITTLTFWRETQTLRNTFILVFFSHLHSFFHLFISTRHAGIFLFIHLLIHEVIHFNYTTCWIWPWYSENNRGHRSQTKNRSTIDIFLLRASSWLYGSIIIYHFFLICTVNIALNIIQLGSNRVKGDENTAFLSLRNTSAPFISYRHLLFISRHLPLSISTLQASHGWEMNARWCKAARVLIRAPASQPSLVGRKLNQYVVVLCWRTLLFSLLLFFSS